MKIDNFYTMHEIYSNKWLESMHYITRKLVEVHGAQGSGKRNEDDKSNGKNGTRKLEPLLMIKPKIIPWTMDTVPSFHEHPLC
jgi:hypothetical protein